MSASTFLAEVTVDGDRCPLSIANNGNDQVCFYLRSEGIFQSMSEMSRHIRQIPNDEPLERKAWQFLMEHVNYLPAYSEDRNAHDPLTLINSIGHGQCDDLAAALTFLWRALGFQARVWTLGGHVVPEVYARGSWHMYDPSFQVYYLRDDGIVAGVMDIIDDPDIIIRARKRMTPKRLNNMDPTLLDSLRYSELVRNYYASDTEKAISEWYDETLHTTTSVICIPPGAEMHLPAHNGPDVFVRDWYGNSFPRQQLFSVKLSAKTAQYIRVPFAMVEENADCAVSQYRVTEGKETPFFLVDTHLIINEGCSGTMYYLLAYETQGSRGKFSI